jgi:hypothetical protein
VLDHGVAQDHGFHTHPLIAVERDGVGVEAVRREEFVVHHHIRTRRAQIAIGACAAAEAAQQLHFE